jgi:hypothetical protein
MIIEVANNVHIIGSGYPDLVFLAGRRHQYKEGQGQPALDSRKIIGLHQSIVFV